MMRGGTRVQLAPEVLASAHARLSATPIYKLAKELGVAPDTLRTHLIKAGFAMPPRRTGRPKAEPKAIVLALPVAATFIKPPTKAQLMAGR